MGSVLGQEHESDTRERERRKSSSPLEPHISPCLFCYVRKKNVSILLELWSFAISVSIDLLSNTVDVCG